MKIKKMNLAHGEGCAPARDVSTLLFTASANALLRYRS